jgi:hypothetical protein
MHAPANNAQPASNNQQIVRAPSLNPENPSLGLNSTENASPAVEVAPSPPAANTLQPATQPVASAAPLQPTAANVGSTAVHTDAPTAREIHSKEVESLDAGDDDLIEKTWVDKSEKIIRENENDPKNEDDLQHDMAKHYLKKRFNLDVT